MSRKWIILDSKCLVSGTSFLAQKKGKKLFDTSKYFYRWDGPKISHTSKVILLWSKNFRNLFSFLQLLDKVKSAFDSTFNSQYFFQLQKKYLLSNQFQHFPYIYLLYHYHKLIYITLYLKKSPEHSDLAR